MKDKDITKILGCLDSLDEKLGDYEIFTLGVKNVEDVFKNGLPALSNRKADPDEMMFAAYDPSSPPTDLLSSIKAIQTLPVSGGLSSGNEAVLAVYGKNESGGLIGVGESIAANCIENFHFFGAMTSKEGFIENEISFDLNKLIGKVASAENVTSEALSGSSDVSAPEM